MSQDNQRNWQRLGAIALVGHRGAGKSTLGRRVADELGRPFYDLDEEIGHRSDESLSEFVGKELARFRGLERVIFAKLCAQRPAPIIACGAGIDADMTTALVVWIDREDWRVEVRKSRRPRIRPDMSETDEWDWMEELRRPRWLDAATFRLPVPRGRRISRSAQDLAILLRWAAQAAESSVAARMWIVPLHRDDLDRAIADAERFRFAGVEIRSDVFEKRPDLLDGVRHLASLRHDDPQWLLQFGAAAAWDIDISYADAVAAAKPHNVPAQLITSMHPDRVTADDVQKLAAAAGSISHSLGITQGNVALKYVPTISTFDELDNLLDLLPKLRESAPNTTILAGGPTMAWTRPIFAAENATNYLPVGLRERRLDHPSALDLQDFLPYLAGPYPTRFDALVGDPVFASQGGVRHRYEALNDGESDLGYLKIRIPKKGLDRALSALSRLPIRGLSVTSPLKIEAASSDRVSNPADLPALNTLVRTDDNLWRGTDTDEDGMIVSLKFFESNGLGPGRAIVFGRGGASHAVIRGLEAANWHVVEHISARRGWRPEHRDISDIDLIINAAGSGDRNSEFIPAAQAWLDLHYCRVSPPPTGQRHLIGDIFFDGQAHSQRIFWSE